MREDSDELRVDRGSAAPEAEEEQASPTAEPFDPERAEGAVPRVDATDVGDRGAPADALGNPREGEGSERR